MLMVRDHIENHCTNLALKWEHLYNSDVAKNYGIASNLVETNTVFNHSVLSSSQAGASTNQESCLNFIR